MTALDQLIKELREVQDSIDTSNRRREQIMEEAKQLDVATMNFKHRLHNLKQLLDGYIYRDEDIVMARLAQENDTPLTIRIDSLNHNYVATNIVSASSGTISANTMPWRIS